MEQDLIVQGISLAGVIILAVQALKFVGVTDERVLRWSPFVVGLVFIVLAGVGEFLPAAAPIVGLILKWLVGALSAILAYAYVGKPLAQQLGIKVTANEISGK